MGPDQAMKRIKKLEAELAHLAMARALDLPDWMVFSGAVYQPVFTAFGPKAIETRLSASSPRLVVTDTANRPDG